MLSACINRINIYYRVRGKGEPLVLLHGAQGDSSTFNGIVDCLANHFMVITFDQRGSGQSDKPDIEYSMELLADDTAQLMQHLGIVSAHIFAVSLGGMIAQSLAVRYPEKVKSLMLGCTLPGGWSHAIKLHPTEQVQLAFSDDENIPPETRAHALASVAYAPDFSKRNPRTIQQLVEMRKNNPIDQVGMQRRLAMTDLYEGYDDLAKIKCPCLVVTGKLDQLIDWRNSVALSESISSSSLLVLEHSGHVFWDEERDLFLSGYLSFLHRLA